MKRMLCLVMIGLFIFPVSALAENSQVPSGLAEDQVEKKVDNIMEKYIGEDIPGASIAIVKDGEVLLQKGYGMSDIDKGEEVDPEETVFEAGSISKPYTWSAVMQLVEQGKLDLDEDIREYLPEDYLELELSKKVTMLDLMNHTAGFEDKMEGLLTTNPEEVVPLNEFLSRTNGQPKQVYQPGTTTAYSNYGASLAGYIVENISGEDFATYMRKHMLDELEMEHTTFEPDYSGLPEISDYKGKSYAKAGSDFEKIERVYVNDAPAGALNTTVADMANFMLAQLNANDYSLFDQENTLEEMHQQTYHTHEKIPGNAHGFWERYVNNHRVLEHGGNVVGYTSQLELVPEEEFGYALLMNVGEEASGLRIDLMEALIGKSDMPEKVTKSQNDVKVEGTYRAANVVHSNFQKILAMISGADTTIKQNKQGGIIVKTAAAPEPIHYTETDDLLYERVDDIEMELDKGGFDTSRIAFELDEEGNVVKMTHGIITDFLPVDWKDRTAVNLIFIIMSVLTFGLYAIVLAVRWLICKRKKVEKQGTFLASGLLSSIGLFISVNLVVLLGRFMLDPFQKLASLNVHVWLNWLLPIAIIVSGYFMLKDWKQSKLFVKTIRIFLLIISVLFVLFLLNFKML